MDIIYNMFREIENENEVTDLQKKVYTHLQRNRGNQILSDLVEELNEIHDMEKTEDEIRKELEDYDKVNIEADNKVYLNKFDVPGEH